MYKNYVEKVSLSLGYFQWIGVPFPNIVVMVPYNQIQLSSIFISINNMQYVIFLYQTQTVYF